MHRHLAHHLPNYELPESSTWFQCRIFSKSGCLFLLLQVRPCGRVLLPVTVALFVTKYFGPSDHFWEGRASKSWKRCWQGWSLGRIPKIWNFEITPQIYGPCTQLGLQPANIQPHILVAQENAIIRSISHASPSQQPSLRHGQGWYKVHEARPVSVKLFADVQAPEQLVLLGCLSVWRCWWHKSFSIPSAIMSICCG